MSHCASESLARRVEMALGTMTRLTSHHPDGADLRATLEALGERRSMIALDGYHFDEAYEHEVREAASGVLAVYDTDERASFDVDVLVNQNLEAPALTYRVPGSSKVLLGTRFALLRPEFLATGFAPRVQPELATRILVTFGGGDPSNHTLTVMRALEEIDRDLHGDLSITVVIGAVNPNRTILEQAIASMNMSVQLAVDAGDMPELMRGADLAISAAGSTVWELCHLGVPTVVMVVADNQIGIARGLNAAGAAVSLGDARLLDVKRMAGAIRPVLQDRTLRASLSEHAAVLVDGQGASRVVDVMLSVTSERGVGEK